MRKSCVSLCAAFLVWIQGAGAAAPSDSSLSYPGTVALAQSAPGVWGYKSFPKLLPLYVFEGEPAGRSLCDRDCTAVWPIIQAQQNDKPVGLWTIVKREDGRFQWAYKNRPVYTYFEDRPNDAKGVGKLMGWYLDEQASVYLMSVGVQPTPALTAAKTKKAPVLQARAELLQP